MGLVNLMYALIIDRYNRDGKKEVDRTSHKKYTWIITAIEKKLEDIPRRVRLKQSNRFG